MTDNENINNLKSTRREKREARKKRNNGMPFKTDRKSFRMVSLR